MQPGEDHLVTQAIGHLAQAIAPEREQLRASQDRVRQRRPGAVGLRICGGSVADAVYDDRVEVTFSGGPHFALTVDDLFRPHESLPWNPLIARVFYLRGVVEQWGRGIERMVELMAAAGLARPEIESAGGAVTVRFRHILYVAPTRVRQDLSAVQRSTLEVLASAWRRGGFTSPLRRRPSSATTGRGCARFEKHSWSFERSGSWRRKGTAVDPGGSSCRKVDDDSLAKRFAKPVLFRAYARLMVPNLRREGPSSSLVSFGLIRPTLRGRVAR